MENLIAAGEGDPELTFMARRLSLCTLPRTNPGREVQNYVGRNGPYRLTLTSAAAGRLPYGDAAAASHDVGVPRSPRASHGKLRTRPCR